MLAAPDDDAARLRLDNAALRAEVARLQARVAELKIGGGEVGHIFGALGYEQTPGSSAMRQTVVQLLQSTMGVIVGARGFIGTSPYRARNIANAERMLQMNIELCIPANFAARVACQLQPAVER